MNYKTTKRNMNLYTESGCEEAENESNPLDIYITLLQRRVFTIEVMQDRPALERDGCSPLMVSAPTTQSFIGSLLSVKYRSLALTRIVKGDTWGTG